MSADQDTFADFLPDNSIAWVHTHAFTIPVAWEYFIHWEDGTVRHPTTNIPPAMKEVTRLRCICGEETSR